MTCNLKIDTCIIPRKSYNGGVLAIADGVSGMIAVLERNGTLKIANVGDCRLRVIVKVSNVELMEGDTVVMGSDGFFDNILHHEIVSIVAGYRDVAEAVKDPRKLTAAK
ncbi:hypothetical protein DVH24_038381 [Malus domestica]|uniref:Protein phosphatase n=1 Tax=Malus domestica TaxID=3750 RepID=A0A498K9X9_MALDO|nr:hypothetical protein DVH24_038381 [Malus domestica]